MKFDKSTLGEHFANLSRVEGKAYPDHYVISNEFGSTIAQIVFTPGDEMNIEVDNFPGQKQYYSSSIPCRSLLDFEMDLQRVGIDLVRISDKRPDASMGSGLIDHINFKN